MSTNDHQTITIKDTTSNPAPLGLLAFGMTTVLLNIHNAGYYPLDSMILGMGLFYGGIAQIIAGIMEWKKNNTFGTTAFISYGSFWLTLVGLICLPKMNLGVAANDISMGCYLGMWGLFSVVMLIATFKLSRALQFVFASLVVLYFLLAIGDFTGNAALKTFAGYEGIVCGLSALYTGFAQIFNELYGREVVPLGKM